MTVAGAGAILAIDQGTSSTKAIVVDEQRRVLAEAERALRPAYLPDGGVEQDPAALLDSVLDAGRDAVVRAGRPVDRVALANQGETVLAWDPDSGAPLSPAIVWQDRRAAGICARLADHGAELATRTGLVLDPYFSAPKMAWLRAHVTRDGVVTTTDSWLIHALCGEFITDAATASRSLLIDLDAVAWDDTLAQLFGLADERRPEIVDCDRTIGMTTAFGSPMTVGGLIVDQAAALLAQGCHRAGEAKCTFGTGAFLLANAGPTATRSRAGLTCSIAWRTVADRAYCVDGQLYTVASAVRWLSELGVIADAAELDAVAAADSGGALCVPALAGLAAPWWRADATASLSGLTLSTGRGQVVTALLEGIAAQVAELVSVVAGDLGRPLHALRVDGGLTRSWRLMQAVADIAQLPVVVSASPHATALGAAALARMAAAPGLTPDEAVGERDAETRHEPAWSPDRAESFRARWRAAAVAALPAPAATESQGSR